MPRFKSKNRYKSITYPQSGFKLKDKLELSKIGEISIKKHRELRENIKTLTIKKTWTNKWFAIFISEVEIKPKKSNNKKVGIDAGVRNLATLSDGTTIENPSYLKKSESKLKKLQKSLSKKKKRSKNRKKARLKVARIHEKIHNQRMDHFHKISRMLADNYGTIVVEDLKIKNMLKNHYLAKSISDSSWNKLLQLISYKAEEAGGELVVVEARGTTQNCSRCGKKVPKKLKDRVHNCPYCGLKIDCDLNASINILKRGTPGTGGTYAWGDGTLVLSKNQEAQGII